MARDDDVQFGGHRPLAAPALENEMRVVSTTDAPTAIGPYSQARVAADLLFISGQLPIEPATGKMDEGGADEQLRQCLANVSAITMAAGTDLSRTVKVTLLVRDLTQFAAVNKVYASLFSAPYPARTTFEVSALPMGALVEVDAVVAL